MRGGEQRETELGEWRWGHALVTDSRKQKRAEGKDKAWLQVDKQLKWRINCKEAKQMEIPFFPPPRINVLTFTCIFDIKYLHLITGSPRCSLSVATSTFFNAPLSQHAGQRLVNMRYGISRCQMLIDNLLIVNSQ